MGELLGEDFALVLPNNLYRCLDKLTEHKKDLFKFLRDRWKDLFQADFEVLLYDLTSTYFECDPPGEGKRKFGYSRDKRSDCVQVVIALIVTPDGFPLAYEVMDGNTSDKTTLKAFLAKIAAQYGAAKRTWVMDRGIPTEEVLAEMRGSPTPIHYLVGTPRGRLTKLGKALAAKPWEDVRENVRVKLIEDGEETYVLARSQARRDKEQGIRRRRLRKLIKRLRELQGQELTRDALLLKLGAAKKEAGGAYGLLKIHKPKKDQPVTPQTFHFAINRKKLRAARRREGGYLLRSNIKGEDPGHLWRLYLQLVEIEQAFKELKNDLSVRPIHHQLETRIEAHIFVAFLAYCLMVTLKQRLKALAKGLTPKAVSRIKSGGRRDPDDRRRTSHDRRSNDRPIPPYRTGKRSPAPAAAPQARTPRPAAAENHGPDRRPSRLISPHPCSADLWTRAQAISIPSAPPMAPVGEVGLD